MRAYICSHLQEGKTRAVEPPIELNRFYLATKDIPAAHHYGTVLQLEEMTRQSSDHDASLLSVSGHGVEVQKDEKNVDIDAWLKLTCIRLVRPKVCVKGTRG